MQIKKIYQHISVNKKQLGIEKYFQNVEGEHTYVEILENKTNIWTPVCCMHFACTGLSCCPSSRRI
jgi:hypothetical protein